MSMMSMNWKQKLEKMSHWCNLEEVHFFWRKRLLFLLPLHFLAFLWLVASCPPPLVTSKHHCLGSQDECFLNEPLVQTRAGYFKNFAVLFAAFVWILSTYRPLCVETSTNHYLHEQIIQKIASGWIYTLVYIHASKYTHYQCYIIAGKQF